MPGSSDRVCVRVHYTGRVQRVGFRYTVVSLAQQWPITGWVRNLPDGRVELLGAGARSDLLAFLASIRHRFSRNIVGEESDWREATDRYTSFDVSD